MFRSNSMASSSSRSVLGTIPNIVNEEQKLDFQIDNSLSFGDWNIPKVSSKEIYRKRLAVASFNAEHHVKMVEQTYALSKEQETCQLFTAEQLKSHRKDGHNFIHVGLVQIAVKPLTRRGLNTSTLLCLRDARFTEFSDSILGMVESSLFNGPIHFDCYANLTLSLSDPHILKALTLKVKTSGYKVLEGTQPLALIYRIYYKVTGTNMNFQALAKSPKDHTLLIQTNIENAHISVPKTINWSDINLPSDWCLINESKPVAMQNTTVNLDNIKQYFDGTVEINFDRPPRKLSTTTQYAHSHRSLATSSRNSFSGSMPYDRQGQDQELINSISNRKLKSVDTGSSITQQELINDLLNYKLQSLETSSQVTHPVYRPTNHEQGEPSPQVSPIASDFEASQVPQHLLVLNRAEPYKIIWKDLTKDIEAPENVPRRNNFRSKYTEKESPEIVQFFEIQSLVLIVLQFFCD